MEQFKLIPADEMKDKLWGKPGTPERDAMEAQLQEDVHAYMVGEAIRKARQEQNWESASVCSGHRYPGWKRAKASSPCPQ